MGQLVDQISNTSYDCTELYDQALTGCTIAGLLGGICFSYNFIHSMFL